MALLPRTYEPPELLLARIRQVKDDPNRGNAGAQLDR
jgi:hypothetical protein